MIDAGICDGDHVVIRRQSTADEGQIVVAMVDDGDCTLKRYFLDRDRGAVRLHPENRGMQDMYFDSVSIQGVAVKIIKSVEV
jgi:repressor LexA